MTVRREPRVAVPTRAVLGSMRYHARPTLVQLISLRGGASDMSFQAYDWTVNIGTPATLVAGAALATLLEGGLSEGLRLRRDDKIWVRKAKKLCLLMLVLAFSTEICVVFMSTVMGTVLLTGGRADLSAGGSRWAAFDPVADSPMGLLQREMEFEYLAIGVGFVQGLLNWLVAIGLRFVVQRAADDGHDDADDVDEESRYLFLGMALSTVSLVLFLLSFYNQHLDVRGNYFSTVSRLAVLFCHKYLTPHDLSWPPQPLPLLMLPVLATALWCFAQSFILTKGPPLARDQIC